MAQDNNNRYYLYTLSDPAIPNLVFYVGRTINPRQRYQGHIHFSLVSSERDAWVKTLLILGRKPHMEILGELVMDSQSADKEEWRIIRRMKREGHPLVNAASRWSIGNTGWRQFYRDAPDHAPVHKDRPMPRRNTSA